LSLGFAIFITGWIGGELADVFKDEREVVFMIALFIPLLSILGVSLVRLNHRAIDKNNNHCHFNMANRIFT
jgi:predicted MFS family arabinose efflux permease